LLLKFQTILALEIEHSNMPVIPSFTGWLLQLKLALW